MFFPTLMFAFILNTPVYKDQEESKELVSENRSEQVDSEPKQTKVIGLTNSSAVERERTFLSGKAIKPEW